jgi:protein required for attachment to host cells
MKLAHDTIILVVDGARMLLLRNHGDTVYPDLRVVEHRQIEIPQNRDLLSDAPGLDMTRGHPGRSTLNEGDPHQAFEDQFVAAAADALAGLAGDGASDIVVVAPPRALGVLRRHYAASVKPRIMRELDKDLTGHPVDAITRLLTDHA